MATIDLRRDISRVIRQVRPERMLIHSPERNWDRLCQTHPDHLAAGDATMAAIYPDARNPFAHRHLLDEEGLEAWTVAETWVFGAPVPNQWVDVTEYLDRQVAALREHHSQTDHDAGPRRRRHDAAGGGGCTGRASDRPPCRGVHGRGHGLSAKTRAIG